MIQDEDKDIVSEVVIGTHITHLLETARVIVEKTKTDHRGLDYIKISYNEGGRSLGCKYYLIYLYKDTDSLLREIERWIRSFIKGNSDIDFTNGASNGAFKNFKFGLF